MRMGYDWWILNNSKATHDCSVDDAEHKNNDQINYGEETEYFHSRGLKLWISKIIKIMT